MMKTSARRLLGGGWATFSTTAATAIHVVEGATQRINLAGEEQRVKESSYKEKEV